MENTCKKHPDSDVYIDLKTRKKPRYRCKACNVEYVTEYRRKVKKILVEEHGGKCKKCGYNKCLAALEFHHIDPTTKDFGIGSAGMTRSLERCRKEAEKCILLCSNCHKETEAACQPGLETGFAT